ncbi:hypothetical protein F4802DRAFT_566993 [Xylaria palmicola]|nr:hypothetical protein F4802DRAFT_566993 [Xylaria palmicola]
MTPSTTRLLASTTSKLASLSLRPSSKPVRAFSQTCQRREGENPPAPRPSLLSRLSASTQQQPNSWTNTNGVDSMSDIRRILATGTISRARNQPSHNKTPETSGENREDWGPSYEPFHFHVLSHRHNTHITVTKPNRCAIISISAGNIGFKKAKRGSYDAAYQLCAFVLDKLNQGGWHRKINSLEVVLRGFGNGREAVTKVLLGNEGRLLRPYITKVSDATRLKFGGTRSPNPRRLG